MQQLPSLREMLVRCNDAVQEMASAQSLEAFESAWIEYLHRLERFWNKSLSHFGKSPKWAGWSGRYQTERRKDQLLAYLTNARGADEHTVAPITERSAGGVGINAAEGNSLYIERMEVRNGEIFIQSPQAIKVTFFPDRVRLLPVTNRGRTYPVPVSHLGQSLDPNDVVQVARVGLGYYENFLATAEGFLCQPR
ncbi:hypothetical protein LJB71_11365 [Thermomonas sp. S9]|uniref:hypothetical protein n=1 Tax=Thermomonas sp. S9 TaxID=2885203 RepID=UPI00216B1987|nr:hypothetical protein [Thermomonas sp. S9]MCR6496748.1 hypothetical protein [Thermomonas sp. S9]